MKNKISHWYLLAMWGDLTKYKVFKCGFSDMENMMDVYMMEHFPFVPSKKQCLGHSMYQSVKASFHLQQEVNAFRWQRPVSLTEQRVQVCSSGFFPLTGAPVAQHGKHSLHMN